jgi:hypothetical protein
MSDLFFADAGIAKGSPRGLIQAIFGNSSAVQANGTTPQKKKRQQQ